MQIEFHVLASGDGAMTETRNVCSFDVAYKNAVHEASERFRTLIAQNPAIGSIFVVWCKVGDPVVVAAEKVTSIPSERQLVWLANQLEWALL